MKLPSNRPQAVNGISFNWWGDSSIHKPQNVCHTAPRANGVATSGSPGRKPGGQQRRWLVRHPAGSRLAAECWIPQQKAPGASPGASSGEGRVD